MQPSHSKIAYGMFLSCQPTLSVYGWSISPICDHGGPYQSPKTSRDTPATLNVTNILHQSICASQSLFVFRDSECNKYTPSKHLCLAVLVWPPAVLNMGKNPSEAWMIRHSAIFGWYGTPGIVIHCVAEWLKGFSMAVIRIITV